MNTARGFWLLCAGFAFALPGCGSDDLSRPDADADAGADAPSNEDAPSSAECPAPGYAEPPDPVRVGTFRAVVTDPEGNPLEGVLAQVCGIDVCIYVDILANGNVLHAVNTDIDKPAFKYGDGVGYVKFAQLIEPATDGSVDLGDVLGLPLPDIATGTPLTPGTSVESGGVTLELAANASVEIDPFDFDTDEKAAFRAVEVALADAPPAVDPALGLELVFATTPAGALLCPAAVLTVPNSPAWPAGTAVEVFAHGTAIEEPWAPYGGWAKVSDAEVSADGATITTRGYEGLPTLSVIGLRRTAP